MEYTLSVLSRWRIPSPCCNYFLLYTGCRFPTGEAIDFFHCSHCSRSYSLAEVQALRGGRRRRAPGQLVLLLPPRETPVAGGKDPS